MSTTNNPVLSESFESSPAQSALDAHAGEYYIYRIVNLSDGRVYVGQRLHRRGESWMTYTGSGSYLTKDQALFPPTQFRKSLIQWADSSTQALVAEALWIERALATGNSYNNSNAKSAMAWGEEEAFFALALRQSFFPEDQIRASIKELRRARVAASNLSEKSSLNRDLLAYTLALGMQHDRYVSSRSLSQASSSL